MPKLEKARSNTTIRELLAGVSTVRESLAVVVGSARQAYSGGKVSEMGDVVIVCVIVVS